MSGTFLLAADQVVEVVLRFLAEGLTGLRAMGDFGGVDAEDQSQPLLTQP